MIDQIVQYNREFVASKGYEQYRTDKYPDKKLAVLSCMDTRLTELLPAALGLRNGDAKIIKNAGGLVISAFHLTMHCFLCHVESGTLTLKEHEAARWLAKEELDCVH